MHWKGGPLFVSSLSTANHFIVCLLVLLFWEVCRTKIWPVSSNRYVKSSPSPLLGIHCTLGATRLQCSSGRGNHTWQNSPSAQMLEVPTALSGSILTQMSCTLLTPRHTVLQTPFTCVIPSYSHSMDPLVQSSCVRLYTRSVFSLFSYGSSFPLLRVCFFGFLLFRPLSALSFFFHHAMWLPKHLYLSLHKSQLTFHSLLSLHASVFFLFCPLPQALPTACLFQSITRNSPFLQFL